MRVTSCQQLQEVTKKSRPGKPFFRKNNAQLAVGVEAGPPPLHLKRRPCRFTPIWALFFRGLKGEEQQEPQRYGFDFHLPYCVLKINVFLRSMAWTPIEASCALGQDVRR